MMSITMDQLFGILKDDVIDFSSFSEVSFIPNVCFLNIILPIFNLIFICISLILIVLQVVFLFKEVSKIISLSTLTFHLEIIFHLIYIICI